MPTISVLLNEDGLWAVTAPNLVVTGLTKEAADAFAAKYLSVCEERPAPLN